MWQTVSNYRTHYKSIIALGIPIIIGQLGSIITGLADTIMVGQHSTAELAAASFTNNVVNAFIVLGTGFSFNLTPLIGESLARNKRWAIGGWLKNSMVANMTTSLFLLAILAGIYFSLDMLNQPDEIMSLIRPYYLITMCSLVFVMLFNSFRQFVEGIAEPRISMWVLLWGNILNVFGNYLLIYGKFGFPELGLFGAGISTLVARILMLVMLIAVFVYKKSYAPYRKGFLIFPVNRDSWRRLNVIGWPIGIQQGLESATFCVAAIMVGWLGSLSLAAHQIAITISLVSFTIFLGLSSAVAIRVSYFKGANDWEMVRKIILAGIHITLVIVMVVCIVLFVSKEQLGYIFTDDTAVNDIVQILLPILMLYQLSDSLQILLTNSLRGLSDVKYIMLSSFIAYLLIAIPSGYLLGFKMGWGIAGIWFAYPIGFFCSDILLTIRVRKLIQRQLGNANRKRSGVKA